MPYYYDDDNLGKARSINGNLDWFVIDYLYEPVNDNKD